MSNTNTGGPAFPSTEAHGMNNGEPGMTLRDYFAAKALPITYQYWMTDYYHPDASDADLRACEGRGSLMEKLDLIAQDAYEIADAMLKARES